jgi:hypothetical protein
MSKREYFDEMLFNTTSDSLWAACAWRKGHRVNLIPPLHSVDGTISAVPADIASSLSAQFFPTACTPVPLRLDDNPALLPTCPFELVTPDEVAATLSHSSDGSAPGPSGLSYKLVKWAFRVAPQRFVNLFNSSLSFGIHPWKHALVVPLVKPGKPDYSAPSAYCPISLLECCGKLLEQIVSRHLLDVSNSFDINRGSNLNQLRVMGRLRVTFWTFKS